MNITEKASYLCGLMEGMNLDTTTNEGKMIDKLVDLISDMADEIAELEEKIATLNDYVEELDEDLGDVEELLCEGEKNSHNRAESYRKYNLENGIDYHGDNVNDTGADRLCNAE